ncbi:hypothetical protein [Streptomyces sp. B21-083]|uniref:hypothetical protein n=1 Tax=Streptomyces sp. B21-083 TaxID=3039410 RepID=UPI002FF21AA6
MTGHGEHHHCGRIHGVRCRDRAVAVHHRLAHGGRATANIALTEQADYAYRLAYALSGGGEIHPDAHSAAVANLLHSVAPGIVAFALHHLRPLLPDLSDEQWARVDAAAVELDLRLCEDLSGASVMPEAAGSPLAHAPHTPGE